MSIKAKLLVFLSTFILTFIGGTIAHSASFSYPCCSNAFVQDGWGNSFFTRQTANWDWQTSSQIRMTSNSLYINITTAGNQVICAFDRITYKPPPGSYIWKVIHEYNPPLTQATTPVFAWFSPNTTFNKLPEARSSARAAGHLTGCGYEYLAGGIDIFWWSDNTYSGYVYP